MTVEKLAYTVEEACEAAGMRPSRLYEELGRGRLSAVKQGRKTLITAASLRDYIASLPPAKINPPARDRRKAIRAAADAGQPATRGLPAQDRHSHKKTAAA